MIAALWAKIEVYVIVIAVAILAALAWGWHERHAQHKEDIAEAQIALDKANAKTDALQDKLDNAKEANSREIAQRERDHASDLANALAGVKPVIVRVPADSGQVPASLNTPGAASAAASGQANLPLSVERDISAAIVMLAGECQRDRDTALGWQQWYANQAALLDAWPR